MNIMKGILVTLLIIVVVHMNSFGQFAQNQVIAHRGAWKVDNLPQNSIASLKRGIELGCFGVEFDVHLTKDGVLVVNHDRDFYGIDIATSTYKELLAEKFPNGESIPTAKNFIKEGLKQKETKLIFELKTSSLGKEHTLKAVDKAVKLVHKLRAQSMIEYILFDYDAAKRILELDPNAKVSYLNGDLSPAQAKEDGFYGIDYNLSVYQKNPTWIKEAKELGLVVNVWTVNTEAGMREFLDQQVTYITTDEPALLLQVIAKTSEN